MPPTSTARGGDVCASLSLFLYIYICVCVCKERHVYKPNASCQNCLHRLESACCRLRLTAANIDCWKDNRFFVVIILERTFPLGPSNEDDAISSGWQNRRVSVTRSLRARCRRSSSPFSCGSDDNAVPFVFAVSSIAPKGRQYRGLLSMRGSRTLGSCCPDRQAG